jgi:4-amino-4-deoxy-L-arabinose transferase-like glycosyltransferase
MVKSKNTKGLWIALLLLILSIPSVLALIHRGFFPTHDFIYIARISEMFKSLLDGQFPVRWVSGFRYGDPTFNFYAPLPYYLGALFHLLGVGYLDSSKMLFGLSFVLSAFSMYLLGKELYGRVEGILSSMLYLYAPYRSIDIYVRGTLNEAWAFVFFPLIFLFLIKLSKAQSFRNTVLLGLSLAGLFYTHNIMTILFIPFFGFYAVYLLINKKFDKKFMLGISVSVLLGLGLGASFLIPALFEKKFVQTAYLTSGYFNYIGHFVAVRQWFDSPWGYGASLWGPKDDMSFQLGATQWILIFGAIILYCTKKMYLNKKDVMFLPVLLTIFVFSLFLQHNKSTFIWQTLQILAYTQFPWRLLAVSVFFAALIGGYGVTLIKNQKIKIALSSFFIALLLLVNYKYFRPKEYYLDSIDEHYVGISVLEKDDKVPKDYLPIWVKNIKDEKMVAPVLISGEADISGFSKNSKSASFNVNARTDSVIEIPVTYFPGWETKIDGNNVQCSPTDLGLISIAVEAGEHSVNLELRNTPVRVIGNLLTVACLFVIVTYPLIVKGYKSLSLSK